MEGYSSETLQNALYQISCFSKRNGDQRKRFALTFSDGRETIPIKPINGTHLFSQGGREDALGKVILVNFPKPPSSQSNLANPRIF